MQADIDNLRSLRANGFTETPTHGEAPEASFTQYKNSWQGIGIGIIVALLIFFVCWAFLSFKHVE